MWPLASAALQGQITKEQAEVSLHSTSLCSGDIFVMTYLDSPFVQVQDKPLNFFFSVLEVCKHRVNLVYSQLVCLIRSMAALKILL